MRGPVPSLRHLRKYDQTVDQGGKSCGRAHHWQEVAVQVKESISFPCLLRPLHTAPYICATLLHYKISLHLQYYAQYTPTTVTLKVKKV